MVKRDIEIVVNSFDELESAEKVALSMGFVYKDVVGKQMLYTRKSDTLTIVCSFWRYDR